MDRGPSCLPSSSEAVRQLLDEDFGTATVYGCRITIPKDLVVKGLRPEANFARADWSVSLRGGYGGRCMPLKKRLGQTLALFLRLKPLKL